MQTVSDLTRALILEPNGLTPDILGSALGQVMSHGGIDSADFYFQASHYESWSLEDGIVKEAPMLKFVQ